MRECRNEDGGLWMMCAVRVPGFVHCLYVSTKVSGASYADPAKRRTGECCKLLKLDMEGSPSRQGPGEFLEHSQVSWRSYIIAEIVWRIDFGFS
jgi:hypothetical protein